MHGVTLVMTVLALARAGGAADEVKFTDPPGWTRGTTADGSLGFAPPNLSLIHI